MQRRSLLTIAILVFVLTGLQAGGEASLGNNSQENREEYAIAATTRTWAVAPGARYRLFIDVYNLSDYFDSEPGKDKDHFPDVTVLSDTARPVVTLLWEEHFRFQAGVIAQRTYGEPTAQGSVDPWLQGLWKPTSYWSAVLGNLSIPHDYLPAIFYAENYFQVKNSEKGLQLLHKRPDWSDDLFLNYRQHESAGQPEKMDFGYVHHNEWRWLNFTYQAHFTHTGGDNFTHPYNTISDSAQAAGAGLKFHPLAPILWGGSYHYLHSHFRTDAGSNIALDSQVNGDGHLLEAFIRWSRLRVTYGDWHASNYSHEGGDPYYNTSVMDYVQAHWDFLVSEDFSLFGEMTGYFINNNDNGFSHYVKPTFWIEATWHFAIPSKGWSAGADDAPPIERWDAGL